MFPHLETFAQRPWINEIVSPGRECRWVCPRVPRDEGGVPRRESTIPALESCHLRGRRRESNNFAIVLIPRRGELHPGPRGTIPPHFACFLSCQVPLCLPPGARVIRHRRGSLDRCNAGPSSWELDSGPASLSMWPPVRFSCAPLPCVQASPLPWELNYGRWQVH